MELLIIRHGQSTGDLEDRHEGPADFPLSEWGHQQAYHISRYIYREHPLDYLISSPLLRAVRTAEIIAEPLQLPVYTASELTERNNGKLAGMSRHEAMEKYPYPPQGRRYYEPIYGGESELAMRNRVEHFFARLCAEPPGKRVGIVTHGPVISMLFRCFASLPNDSNLYLSTVEAGIHFWHLNQRYRQIIFNNYQGHLSAQP